MHSKDYALKQLIDLNPGAEVSKNDGFVWVILPQNQDFKIPRKYTCPEGLHVTQNTITLHHLYNSNGEFIFTVIARA